VWIFVEVFRVQQQQQQAQQLDQRLSVLKQLYEQATEQTRREYNEIMDLSWIHHDSALEGVVYQPLELAAALRGEAPSDPALVPIFDEIRQNKAAIDLVREMAARKKIKIDLNTLKDLYERLAPEEVEGKKPPAYRKDMPIHRLYFHEIATPDKISYKLRQFMEWVNEPETWRTTHVARLAAKAHFQLLHIYPFPKHSGKLARLVMNLILLSGDYPPAIIHSTERQRYYDALKTNDNALAQIVRDAIVSSMESAIRYFEMHAPPPPPAPTRKAPARAPRKAPTPAPAPAPRGGGTKRSTRSSA
jgi:Fic family protein